MLDKSLLIIMLCMALFGGVIYDRHQVAHGRPSPIGRVLDYAGLSDFAGRDQPLYKQQAFRDDVKGELDRLSRLQQGLQQKRHRLVRDRQEVLARMGDLNARVREDARRFYDLLTVQRKKVSIYYQDLERLNGRLQEAARVSDPRVRGEQLADIEEELMSLFGQISARPREDVPELAAMNQDLASLANGDDLILIERYGSVEGCMSGHIDQLQQVLTRVFEQDVDAPQKNVAELALSAEQLDKEYRFFLKNSRVSMQRIENNETRLSDGLQSLVRLLISVTDEDIRELMSVYQELWDEQEVLLENFKLNEERLAREHVRALLSLEKTLQSLEQVETRDVRALQAACRDVLVKRGALVERFNQNEDHLKLLLFQNWERHAGLLGRLAESFHLRAKDLDAVRRKSQQQAKVLSGRVHASSRGTGGRDQTLSRRDALREKAAAINPSRVDPARTGSSWDQYDRLRGQAADRGFYR